MNGEAALSTVLVHVLGGIMTLMPLGQRPSPFVPPDPKPRIQVEVQAPALALVAESGTSGGADGIGPPLSEGRGCPESAPVDSSAAPDFPLVGESRPFQQVPRALWSPVFCARIGRNGRILELHPTGDGSGNEAADRATTRELARLHFRPASRSGRLVEAWHRILVYLPNTIQVPTTDHPTACLMPGGTSPCEIEPMILTD